MNIAGIQLRPMQRHESCEALRRVLLGNEQKVVITVNPEMIVQATTDRFFKSVIHRAHLHLIDGIGLVLLPRLKGFENIERFTGVDAVEYVCSLASDLDKRVFLLGTGDSTTLLSASNSLRSRYPRLKIVGVHPGDSLTEQTDDVLPKDQTAHQAMLDLIKKVSPDILLVAFGHGKQEKWIDQNRSHFPSVKLFMGVGGALDFIGGTVKRAPVFMQKWGMEWLYRLIRQPKRWRRIWRATIVFLWKAK